MFSTTLKPLDKIAQLCLIIDAYSADAHWNYCTIKYAQTAQDLLSKAEEYDIKNEELFEQFEAFLGGYKELVQALQITPESLSEENMQELGDLVNTLETRYERLQSSGYLSVSPEEGFDEDFDPVDFRELLADIMEDANSRFQQAAGDIDISELKGLEIAKELNQQALDRGDLNMRYTGDKVVQQLEARKKHLEMVKFRRRFARGSPEYQKLIETSRRNYQTIMSDPTRRELYREKSRERQSKFLEGLTSEQIDKRRREIEQELSSVDKSKERDKWEFLRRKLNTIELFLAREERKTTKLREVKKGPSRELGGGNVSLEGLIIHLTQRIATQKIVVKQKITDRLKREENNTFKPFKDAIIAAKTSGNQTALAAAIKQLNKALNDHAENDPSVVAYVAASKEFYEYRNKLKELDKSKWLEKAIIPEILPHIQALVAEGLKLAIKYRRERHFATVVETLDKITHFISQGLP